MNAAVTSALPTAVPAAALTANFTVHRPEFAVGIEFTAAPGEVIALMGPSGAGKTTVLDALSGLSRVDTGSLSLGGQTLADAERHVHVAPSRRQVGVLRQDGDLFPHLTAVDNIAFAIKIRGVRATEARLEAMEWLGRIGLAGLNAKKPSELSGGQARRVALLRALAARPRLLLIDEPFASLDVEAAQDMRNLIAAQLAEHPTTTMLVSHDARDALLLAQRLIVLEAGRVVQQGSVRQVLATPETRFVRALRDAMGPDK